MKYNQKQYLMNIYENSTKKNVQNIDKNVKNSLKNQKNTQKINFFLNFMC